VTTTKTIGEDALQQQEEGIDAMALSGDRKTLVVAVAGDDVRAFRLAAKKWAAAPLQLVADAPLRNLVLSNDGSILYGATKSDVIRSRVGSAKGKAPAPILLDSAEEVRAIALRHDEEVLAACVGDAVILYDTKSGDEIEQRRGSAMQACAFAEDGNTIVGLNDKGAITLLDATDNLKRTGLVATSDARLRHLALAGDLVALASMNPKSPIKVFSIETKRTAFTLTQHTKGGITAVAFSSDGSRLASAGEDGHVRVWDIAKKKLVSDLTVEEQPKIKLSGVAFLDEKGTKVAAAGSIPPIYVWDV